MFKRSYRPLFLLVIITLSAGLLHARSSGDGLWHEVAETSAAKNSMERSVSADEYRTFSLNKTMLRTILSSAPEEFSDPFGMSNAIVTLPMPDGSFERFRIEHSLVVDPLLAQKYPELGMTFRGQGVDDPAASVRFDLLPSGFHSMVISPRGTVVVDPSSRGETSTYISYFKRDARKSSDYSCEFDAQDAVESMGRPSKLGFEGLMAHAVAAPSVTSGSQLRTYRLALAATGEYTATVGGGTVAGALAAQVVIMNRVNGVYERDLAIRMVIIGNNDQIIYTNGTTDPYTNNSGSAMLTENLNNLNTVITPANFDVGHVFSTGGGGVASLGVPCGPNKARGVTGLSNPTGDIFAIDFVAHELGHQWGASHTFNSTSGNCGSPGQRSFSSSFEPGSGITIMGYAGICDAQDLAASSIDSFHVKSLEDIIAFSSTGAGSTCGTPTATGNTPPVISSVGGTSFNIPKQTPFTLTASATDANGDTVTYDWQQYDLGPGTTLLPNSDSDGFARPIFRVYGPSTNPSRTFPSNQFILGNANIPPATISGFLTGELLPSIARTMNFQVIARDNRANGGGIDTASVSVVVSGSGPFQVREPNTATTWYLNSNPTLTWDVAGSNGAPVNATNVRILLSTDGGVTFPHVLAENTPNDGTESVVSPAINTGTARIRIEAVGNIFFDVSDVNFAVTAAPATFASFGGKITTAAGRGIGGVYVTITGGNPVETKVALTNAFGYYQFQEITFGSYTVRPTPRKNTRFNPTNIVRNHQSAATDVNFVTQ